MTILSICMISGPMPTNGGCSPDANPCLILGADPNFGPKVHASRQRIVDVTERIGAFVTDWMIAAPEFSVLVELKTLAGDSITIHRIDTWPTDKRAKAEASLALTALCHLADLHEVTLLSYAQPYGNNPEAAIRLRLWLARYGFEPSEEVRNDRQLSRAPSNVVEMTGNIWFGPRIRREAAGL